MPPWSSVRVALTYRCNRDCSYCYAKGLSSEYGKDMSREDFGAMLKWLEKNKARYASESIPKSRLQQLAIGLRDRLSRMPPNIVFLGGEPTIHPDFVEFAEMCRREGFRASVLSNGLFGDSVRRSLSPELYYYFMINYNPEEDYSSGQWELLHKNLSAIMESGVELWLRFNIPSEDTPVDFVIEAAKKYSAKGIRFGTTNPGFSEGTKYVEFEKISEMGEKVRDFVKKCEENEVACHLARPLPMCSFRETDWDWLKRHAGFKGKCYVGRAGNYAYRVIVNPDLSTYVCFSVFLKGPSLLSHKNLKSLSDYYEKKFEQLRWTPLMERCKSCRHFLDKECQGGCLSYKCSNSERVGGKCE